MFLTFLTNLCELCILKHEIFWITLCQIKWLWNVAQNSLYAGGFPTSGQYNPMKIQVLISVYINVSVKIKVEVCALFLAHLSTMCSGWAFLIGLCLSSVHPYVNNCLKYISSETTWPNSMKHHMKLLWVTVYKYTTRRHDWPTTTKCPASYFALITIEHPFLIRYLLNLYISKILFKDLPEPLMNDWIIALEIVKITKIQLVNTIYPPFLIQTSPHLYSS